MVTAGARLTPPGRGALRDHLLSDVTEQLTPDEQIVV